MAKSTTAKKPVAKTPTAKSAIKVATAVPKNRLNKAQWVDHVMTTLAQVDKGNRVTLDFVCTEDVNDFCTAVGFKKGWGGRTIDEIAPKDKLLDVNVVPADEAKIISDILVKMIGAGQFKSRDGTRFDKTILNDFLPKTKAGFQGEPTLGHFWEFRYALSVELEHGRTVGTNVTNNHPLLTALVVMAHLTEDKLYYARLIGMEFEGELTNAVLESKPAKEVGEISTSLQKARLYLGRRLNEKLKADFPLPI